MCLFSTLILSIFLLLFLLSISFSSFHLIIFFIFFCDKATGVSQGATGCSLCHVLKWSAGYGERRREVRGGGKRQVSVLEG